MRYLIVFAAMLLTAPAQAEWTSADTAREAVYLGLHVADWGQTLSVPGNCDRYTETNPILGKCPSRGDVNRYFAITGAAHAAVAYLLPRPYREAWQYVWIGFEAHQVATNWQAGVRFNF